MIGRKVPYGSAMRRSVSLMIRLGKAMLGNKDCILSLVVIVKKERRGVDFV